VLVEILVLLGWFLVLVILSNILSRVWLNSLSRWAYLVFAAPGIIVHELSHLVACWLTGARVTNVKLMSIDGGSVTHGPPKGGVFGQAFVSMAPLIGIPSALVLVGFLFHNVNFFKCDLTWDFDLHGNMIEIAAGALSSAWDMVVINIWENHSPWFVLYLYLAVSFTAALAPSWKDLKNSWVGIAALSVVLVVWGLILDHILFAWSAPVTKFLVGSLTWIAAVGFVFSMIALIIGLLLFIVRKIRDQADM
jgi:hypothetical protein